MASVYKGHFATVFLTSYQVESCFNFTNSIYTRHLKHISIITSINLFDRLLLQYWFWLPFYSTQTSLFMVGAL